MSTPSGPGPRGLPRPGSLKPAQRLSGLGQGHRPCPAWHTLCRFSQGCGVSATSPAALPGTQPVPVPRDSPAPCPSSLPSSCTHVFPPSASVVLCPLSLGTPCPVLTGRSRPSPLWARSACSSHTRLCSTPVSCHSSGAAGRGWAPLTFLLGTAGRGPQGHRAQVATGRVGGCSLLARRGGGRPRRVWGGLPPAQPLPAVPAASSSASAQRFPSWRTR